MHRDIARDHCRADAGRLERRDLLVHRPDDHALLVAEHGRIDGAGNVVLGEFERRADIDDFVEIAQAVDGNEQVFHGLQTDSG